MRPRPLAAHRAAWFLAILLSLCAAQSAGAAPATPAKTPAPARQIAPATPAADESAPPAPARILYLSSYERGNAWGDGEEAGFRSAIAESGREVEISAEYLDSRRFPGPALRDSFAAHLAGKYSGYGLDLLVAADNAAFDFALGLRAAFPRAAPERLPLVFFGYNDLHPAALRGLAGLAGVNEALDFSLTVDLALALFPRTRVLAFVASTGDDSNARNLAAAEATLLPRYRGAREIALLKDLPPAELSARLRDLPPETLVFLLGHVKESRGGRPVTGLESAALVAGLSPHPCFGFWDFQVEGGVGVVGGRLLRGDDQGRAAAALTLRVLGGEPPESIPLVLESPTTPVFDYAAARRFGLSPGDLPPGSRLLGAPDRPLYRYRHAILAAGFLLAAETLLILALLRAGRQRAAALAALEAERAGLERRVAERTAEIAGMMRFRDSILDNALVTIALLEGKRIRWLSREFENMFGYRLVEAEGREVGFLYADAAEAARVAEESERVLPRGETYKTDCRFRRADGSEFWCTVSGRALDPAKPAGEALYLVIDVDARKRAEMRVAELLSQKEVLLREVHHRVKNNLNTICGLLSLQAASVGEGAAATALRESEGRVRSMAFLYDRIYRGEVGKGTGLADYLGPLAAEIVQGFPNSGGVTLAVELENPVLDSAVLQPLGIVMNELLTNAMKYAFAGRARGALAVAARRDGAFLEFSVADDGVGLPEGVGAGEGGGFGLVLVGVLAAQLRAELSVERSGGTRVVLRLPLPPASPPA